MRTSCFTYSSSESSLDASVAASEALLGVKNRSLAGINFEIQLSKQFLDLFQHRLTLALTPTVHDNVIPITHQFEPTP
jgi:hypothetical protein